MESVSEGGRRREREKKKNLLQYLRRDWLGLLGIFGPSATVLKTGRRGADRTTVVDQENEHTSMHLVTVIPLKCGPIKFGK